MNTTETQTIGRMGGGMVWHKTTKLGAVANCDYGMRAPGCIASGTLLRECARLVVAVESQGM